jgi:acetyltransferase
VVKAAAATKKPVLTAFMGGPRLDEAVKVLKAAGIPNYAFPERTVSALESMNNYRLWCEKPKTPAPDMPRQKEQVAQMLAKAKSSGRLELGESEAREVVTAYGFQVPKSILARTSVEAIVAGEEVGYPLVMKIASPDILHKSDIGGVKVGIKDPSETRQTFVAMLDNARRRMPEAEIWGVLVQQMVMGGKEVILGMNRDPQFGPMIMFGLGGIYVEALKDVSFRIAPLAVEDAADMIREIHSYPLLRGVRGEKPVNIDAIKDCLLRLSLLVTDFPEIVELDINPLKVFPDGQPTMAIDARLTVAA